MQRLNRTTLTLIHWSEACLAKIYKEHASCSSTTGIRHKRRKTVVMEKKFLLVDLLEIILLTCNRAACLDRTIRQLQDSPFSRCRLTVLDNCSTDDTPVVAARFSDSFPDYRIVRHGSNIGGDKNYLKAVEFSTSKYTWILCDDDNYDFRDAPDIIAAVESCRFDLVYVASRASFDLGWSGFGDTTVRRLMNEGARYHRACAFWPALIFKTERFESSCILHAPDLFPNLPFINKSISDDFRLYVARRGLIIRSDSRVSSPLVLYKEWVKSAASISDRKLRGKVIDQWTDKGFLKSLCFWIALDRTNRTGGLTRRLVDIFLGLTHWQRFQFILLLPVMAVPIPKPVLLRAREMVYRLMGCKDVRTLPPVA